MRKILWVDTETTGLSAKKHSVWQIAAIAEIDGKIRDKVDIKMNPPGDVEIDPEALERGGVTRETLYGYDSYAIGHQSLIALLSRYVDRFDKADKFVMAGYNVHFDYEFLRAFFMRLKDKFFGSWFFWPQLDVATYVAQATADGRLRLPNYKLETVCGALSIPIRPHDALSDVGATRHLYYALSCIVGRMAA